MQHNEFNPDPDRPVHFYQVWIEPTEKGGEPLYSQTKIDLNAAGAVPIIGGVHELKMRQDASIQWVGVGAGGWIGAWQ